MSNSCRSTSENMLRKFPLVIATVAKVSRKRGLWEMLFTREVFCAVQWGISDSHYIKIREIVNSVNVLTPE